jgi:hypothetical protein
LSYTPSAGRPLGGGKAEQPATVGKDHYPWLQVLDCDLSAGQSAPAPSVAQGVVAAPWSELPQRSVVCSQLPVVMSCAVVVPSRSVSWYWPPTATTRPRSSPGLTTVHEPSACLAYSDSKPSGVMSYRLEAAASIGRRVWA